MRLGLVMLIQKVFEINTIIIYCFHFYKISFVFGDLDARRKPLDMAWTPSYTLFLTSNTFITKTFKLNP